MYAVVATGGKQYKVVEGQVLEVERVGAVGSDVELRPVLVVDGSTVLATPADLAGASVKARVLADAKGRKINAFTYKDVTNNRRRWGHRQKLARIEITAISKG
jgi:large subunit ribosomal protein L21